MLGNRRAFGDQGEGGAFLGFGHFLNNLGRAARAGARCSWDEGGLPVSRAALTLIPLRPASTVAPVR